MRRSASTSFGFSQWLLPQLPLSNQQAFRRARLSPLWQIGIALFINILSLALPIMTVQIYDRIIPSLAFNTMALLIIGVLIALAFEAFLRLARAYLVGWSSIQQEYAVASGAFERMTRTTLAALEATTVSTHMQRFSAVARLREFYGGQALGSIVDLPFIIFFLLLLAYLGGPLVLIPLILLTLFICFSFYAGRRLRSALDTRAKADDRKFNFIMSVLTGVHSVKALGMEQSLLRQFESHQADGTDQSYRVALASGFAASLSATFSQLSPILTVTAGCLLVLHGNLTVGGLSACTLLASRCLQPVQRVLGTWLRMQDYALANQQVQDLFSAPVQLRGGDHLPPPRGQINLRDVTFSFPGATSPIFRGISLEIMPGDTIAVIGAKGSGKSALLQLIAGILENQQGIINVDGIMPSQYGMSALAKHVGYLPQKGSIYKGTILENLCGFEDDDDIVDSVKYLCRRMGLDSIIDQLPKGYATQLSDSWSDPIPPGVKQRIALVRALRHQPAAILFDDADQTLDKEGYNRLYGLLGRLKGRSTIVLITEDANLLSLADRVLHLQNAKLHNAGTSTAQQLALLTVPIEEEAF